MNPPRLGVSPPLPPGVYARRPKDDLPFPLREPNARLFPLGRHALWQGLIASRSAPGAEVLVPAYNCGSEVEALMHAGFICRFYEATDDLTPREDQLESLLGPNVRALYLIHYFGFPQDAPRWRRWCDERNILLIEDAAQAWLTSVGGRPVGSFGDLAIIALHKTFGFPDGAVLLMNAPPAQPENRGLGGLSLARRHAAWLLARSPRLAGLGARLAPERDFASEEQYGAFLRAAAPSAFALGDPTKGASSATLFLLPRMADSDAATRRRANYRMLLEELGDMVPPAFVHVPEGTSPFMFPVETTTRTKFLERLAARGVRGLDLWPIPHPLITNGEFPRAHSWRDRLVGLPVHQELRPGDVEHIAVAAREPRSSQAAIRLEPIDELDSLRDEWAQLADGGGNVFATWEWNAIWWRHFGHGHPLLAAACRRLDGRLAAVIPLYLWSARPVRIVRFLGHGLGDELGPICARPDRPAVARALQLLLTRDGLGWDLFLGEHLPTDACWSARLGARPIRHHGNPVLRLEGLSWDGFLARQSANFRQQVRRRERKLARDHDLRYRLADSLDTLQDDLSVLFALHSARWGAATSTFKGEREAFHREFAESALGRGWLRLWFLELGGKPVAGWYGFRLSGIESFYQAGWDPAWARASVGSVLLSHSIRTALEDGQREYRFLRGDDAYKYRYTSEDRVLETIALGRSAVGKSAAWAGGLTHNAPRLPLSGRALLGI
jgi:perosamine synthetase